MITKIYAKMNIGNTAKEIEALNCVHDMMKQISDKLPENATLTNDENGDMIIVSELARVRGILDFFRRTTEANIDFT